MKTSVELGTETIVVATDGGGGSRAAMRWVVDELGPRPARVRIVAVEDATRPDVPEVLVAARLVLDDLVTEATVETDLLTGNPARAIADAARGASLLVVGARTGGGPLTAPRVPARVAGFATCPVVVVPDDWAPGSGPIVVGSAHDLDADAVEHAAGLAARQGRKLVLVHAWKLPVVGDIPPSGGSPESIPDRQRVALDKLAAVVRSRHPGLDVAPELRNRSAQAALAEMAATASLLVIGRRRPVGSHALGSVGRTLLADPPCAVMVIPAPSTNA